MFNLIKKWLSGDKSSKTAGVQSGKLATMPNSSPQNRLISTVTIVRTEKLAARPSACPPGGLTGTADIVQATTLAAMPRAEIKMLLDQIEKTEAPEPSSPDAMCYMAPMSPPDRMDYVCHACGEKTLYTGDVSREWTDELAVCRRIFNEIPNHHTMLLDESSFCKKCQPDAPSPALMLWLRFDDGTTNIVSNITSCDLRLLRDFLAGKLLVKDARDSGTPIQIELPRLRALLGTKDE